MSRVSSLALALLCLTAACSNTIGSKDRGNPASSGGETRSSDVDSTLCVDEVTRPADMDSTRFTTNLSLFFMKTIKNLEAQPTFCLNLSSAGNTDNYVKGTFRLQYVSDEGLRQYFREDPANTFYGSFTRKTSTGGRLIRSVEIIFIDQAGYIQITASSPRASDPATGTIRYYNFPSFEDQLDQQVAQAKAGCAAGVMNPYTCAGLLPPQPAYWCTYGATTDIQQQMLDQAHQLLSDKGTTMGNISFDIDKALGD